MTEIRQPEPDPQEREERRPIAIVGHHARGGGGLMLAAALAALNPHPDDFLVFGDPWAAIDDMLGVLRDGGPDFGVPRFDAPPPIPKAWLRPRELASVPRAPTPKATARKRQKAARRASRRHK